VAENDKRIVALFYTDVSTTTDFPGSSIFALYMYILYWHTVSADGAVLVDEYELSYWFASTVASCIHHFGLIVVLEISLVEAQECDCGPRA